MKVKFDTTLSIIYLLEINDWNAFKDTFNVSFDEINGDKRIIIKKEK